MPPAPAPSHETGHRHHIDQMLRSRDNKHDTSCSCCALTVAEKGWGRPEPCSHSPLAFSLALPCSPRPSSGSGNEPCLAAAMPSANAFRRLACHELSALLGTSNKSQATSHKQGPIKIVAFAQRREHVKAGVVLREHPRDLMADTLREGVEVEARLSRHLLVDLVEEGLGVTGDDRPAQRVMAALFGERALTRMVSGKARGSRDTIVKTRALW